MESIRSLFVQVDDIVRKYYSKFKNEYNSKELRDFDDIFYRLNEFTNNMKDGEFGLFNFLKDDIPGTSMLNIDSYLDIINLISLPGSYRSLPGSYRSLPGSYRSVQELENDKRKITELFIEIVKLILIDLA